MKAFVLSFLALSYFSGAIAEAVPGPVITPAPVAPRQLFTEDGDSFIGYYSTLGTYVPDYCPDGATFSLGDQYAGCCLIDDPDCEVATGCKGNTVFVGDVVTTCENPSASCNTDYILLSSGDDSGWYWLGCATETEHVFYLTYPGEAAASTTSFGAAETTSATPAASASASPTSEPSSPSSHSNSASSTKPNLSHSNSASSTEPNLLSGFPTALATAAPSPSSAPKKSSKAWIAAAVIVPLLLLALAGLLLFFLIRRRRSRPNPYQDPHPEYVSGSTPAPYSPHPQHEQAYGMGMVSPQPTYASPTFGSPRPSFMAPGAVSPMFEPLEPAPAYTESPGGVSGSGSGKGAHVYSYAPVPSERE